MSLSSTISQYAATNPAVAAAVTKENTDSALLAGYATGDSATANLMSALYSKETESEVLLNTTNPVTGASLAPSSTTTSNEVGGHVDISA